MKIYDLEVYPDDVLTGYGFKVKLTPSKSYLKLIRKLNKSTKKYDRTITLTNGAKKTLYKLEGIDDDGFFNYMRNQNTYSTSNNICRLLSSNYFKTKDSVEYWAGNDRFDEDFFETVNKEVAYTMKYVLYLIKAKYKFKTSIKKVKLKIKEPVAKETPRVIE